MRSLALAADTSADMDTTAAGGHNLNIESQLTIKYPNNTIYHLPKIFHSSAASESSVRV